MNQNPGIDAVRTLVHLGYRFTVAGETIKAKYHGSGKPDPDAVRPLFEVMKTYKPDVLTYLSKPASTSTSQTCEPCPWYVLNPWTHYPGWGAWCHYRMEHLVAGSPACEEFRRGEVPLRQHHERVLKIQPSTSPILQEHVLTCADCSNFEANYGPNPRQGWGKCLKRGRGRFGCATACTGAFAQEEASHAYPEH
jgi:hypothetical protein